MQSLQKGSVKVTIIKLKKKQGTVLQGFISLFFDGDEKHFYSNLKSRNTILP